MPDKMERTTGRKRASTSQISCATQLEMPRRRNATAEYESDVVSLSGVEVDLKEVQAIVKEWADCRKETVISLRSLAEKLQTSHRENAKAEYDSARVSLAAGFISISGILLGPFSCGLSLGLSGLSAVTGMGSFLNKTLANKKDDKVTKELKLKLKQVLDEDKKATGKITQLKDFFEYLEQLSGINRIGDIDVGIKKSQLESVVSMTTKLVNFGVALTCGAKEVATCTAGTKEVLSAVTVVSETAGIETSIASLTNGAETTMKAVQKVKQASKTVKTVSQVTKHARLTTHATKFTKVTETATKAASISKLGVAINAVAIPLDVYNFVVAYDNLEKSTEDVDRINDEANRLEQELENVTKELSALLHSFFTMKA